MKALTDWQPWASLIMIGAKEIETRSRPIRYRGPLAIHAAAKLSQSARIWTAATPEIATALPCPVEELPTGAVLGTVNIVACWPIRENHPDERYAVLMAGTDHQTEITISGDEYLFGDYRPGRYAWVLNNPRPFRVPIAAKGRQGLWNWEAVL